jgi:nicotinate-nucleotide adenylyltransferase
MGFDAFLEIDTWKSYQSLFRLIPFIVMARPGSGSNDSTAMEHKLKHFLKTRISDRYEFSAAQNGFVHPVQKPIFFFKISLLDISSTKIRKLVKNGQSIRYLVPPCVEELIITKGLYL